MNETVVTVIGNVVTKPERRRVENSGDTVVSFRIASTSRRFDKASGVWVDGNSFFVRVTCWRSLADNAYQSLFKGDPVMVHGRLSTREYEGDDGVKRSSYELEATALGHNLGRGTSTFIRTRTGLAPGLVSDSDGSPNAGGGEPRSGAGPDEHGVNHDSGVGRGEYSTLPGSGVAYPAGVDALVEQSLDDPGASEDLSDGVAEPLTPLGAGAAG
ncbi:MAG: single-stranded DNA-binding protein [Micromonosporaceae bacterium]